MPLRPLRWSPREQPRHLMCALIFARSLSEERLPSLFSQRASYLKVIESCCRSKHPDLTLTRVANSDQCTRVRG
jgi:hypothetical protein